MIRDTETYIQELKDRGWPVVTSIHARKVVEAWLQERLGESCDSLNYDVDIVTAAWEYLGNSEYLIRDRDVALMFKLTWGGR